VEDAKIKSPATMGELSILWCCTYKVQKSSTGSKVQGLKVYPPMAAPEATRVHG
jgi:hypothetical protein